MLAQISLKGLTGVVSIIRGVISFIVDLVVDTLRAIPKIPWGILWLLWRLPGFLFASAVGLVRMLLNLPRMFAAVPLSTWFLLGVSATFFLVIQAWYKEIENINFVGPGGRTIGGLLVIYAGLYTLTLYAVWNVFVMNITAKRGNSPLTDKEIKMYNVCGFVMMARYILFTIGMNQDSIWHFKEVPTEGHFWWPPHILMYSSFLFGVIPMYYWAKAGFKRSWAREHWPIVLSGVTNIYFVFSGILDENWHYALGPLGFDFNGFSAAHFPIFICQNVGLATTIAIYIKAFGLNTKVRIAGVILGVFGMNLLLNGTAVQGEWFMPSEVDAFWWIRPAWSWSVICLIVGLGLLLFTQRSLKFAWAATLVVFGSLAMREFLEFAMYDFGVSPKRVPMKNAILPVYLGAALVMDFLYWRGVRNPITLASAFASTYWVLSVPVYASVGVGPVVTPTDIVIGILLTAVFVLLYVKSLATSADKVANSHVPITA